MNTQLAREIQLDRWLKILDELCQGTNYEAQFNKAKGSAAGVVIVPRGIGRPQRIAVYPKPFGEGSGLVIEMDVYSTFAEKADLVEYGRIHSKRPHYGDVPDEKIINLCKLFLGKTKVTSARRGVIYEAKNNNYEGTKKVLVVGANHRAESDIVSVIVLNHNNRSGSKRNIVSLILENDEKVYAHCDKVTYIHRENLVSEITEIEEKKMEKIDRYISRELGLLEETYVLLNYYRDAYHRLQLQLGVESELYDVE